MGITIHHKLVQNKIYVRDTLDRAQALARTLKLEQADKLGISFDINRMNDTNLMITIGGCETLAFNFYTIRELVKEKDSAVNGENGWNDRAWKYQCLMRDGKELPSEGYRIDEYPQNELAYASGFCKTQYASSVVEHYWVAEILRKVASYCVSADVSDEGDYYHSGKLEDASESIESLGKMINNLGATLAGNFGGENVIAGGKTIIKTNKRKNAK